MSSDDKGKRFPGAACRPPGGRWSGELAATERPVPRSGLLAGRRAAGVRGDRRRRRSRAVPRPWQSSARPLAVREQQQRRNGRCPAHACRPGGGPPGCQGDRRRRRSRAVPRCLRSAAGPPVVRAGGPMGPGRRPPAPAAHPPGPRRAPLRPKTPSDLGEYAPSQGRGERKRADRRPTAAPGCDVSRTRTGFGSPVSVSPLFVRASGRPGRRRRGRAPARAGPRAGIGPPPVTRSDRERRKRVLSTGRRGAGYRIPFWSGRHRAPARPAGPLRARARPAPPPIRTNGTPGGPDPPETGPGGPVLHREW